MSFQAYIDNIKAKTGKTREDFPRLAERQGLVRTGARADGITAWLQEDFGFGFGHARAIYETLRPNLSGPARATPRAAAPRRGA